LDKLAPTFQTLPPEKYETIVTDDGKNVSAEELIRQHYPWVKWVKGPQKGPASNRNKGAKEAKGEWLVFIDDDCLPEPNVLEAYNNAIAEHPQSLAFEGAILPDNKELLKDEMAECPVNESGNCFWSANICIQRAYFESINGFDEHFLIAAQEDQDLYLRLKQHTVIPFVPSSKVVHPVRYITLKKKLKGMKIKYANWIYFMKKHDSKDIRFHFAKGIKDYLRLSVQHLVRFKFRLAFYYLLNAAYNLYLSLFYSSKPTV